MSTPGNSLRVRAGLVACVLGAAASLSSLAASEPKWISLFDGKSLAGWRQLGGEAKFAVRDGAIVGTVTAGVKQNSFLTTEKTFGDFVFECEFKAADGINSGVQFRSAPPDDKVKRVYGYQCEIDPTPRGLTGGLYEEGRRGWFSPTANNGEPQQTWAKAHAGLYRSGEWNTIRIEARGARLRIWLNGKPTVDYEDKGDVRLPRGFFGLQVHTTNNTALHGKEVLFRHLRVQPLD